MSWHTDVFSQSIFKTKYAGDCETIEELFSNITNLIMKDQDKAGVLFNMMVEKKFCPGGRILAFGGRPDSRVSLMNCTTHEIPGDTLEDISDTAYTIMRASSRGQGIGIDISNLRPIDSPVSNAAKTSTGSISFMEMLNTVGSTIGQEGRRAALLFSIRDDHPDVWRPDDKKTVCQKCGSYGCDYCNDGFMPYDFIHVKKFPGKVESANISVLISDSFMQAVKKNLPWRLHFTGKSGGKEFTVERTVMARDLFNELAMSAMLSAEPGMLYWDTSKRLSNSDLFGEKWAITGVNACSEQVLDQDGVCNLGSMNLAAYVENPFTPDAYFNYIEFEKDVRMAIEFLDNVLDVEVERNRYISERQRESILGLRRVGLGVMGLADAMAMLGIRYGGSEESLDFVTAVFSTMCNHAYLKSAQLAAQKGPAEVWKGLSTEEFEYVLSNGFFRTLHDSIKQVIRDCGGTRNVTLLSVAPTGTISNLFGVTSGIEPLFAHEFTRMTRMYGEPTLIDYIHPGVIESRKHGYPDSIYPTAYEVSPGAHILVQAVAQKFVDQSISKTLNFPAGTTADEVANAYMLGWEHGLKGMAVYVDGSRSEQVLYTNKDDEREESCPACGNEIVHSGGCTECSVCEWAACSV